MIIISLYLQKKLSVKHYRITILIILAFFAFFLIWVTLLSRNKAEETTIRLAIRSPLVIDYAPDGRVATVKLDKYYVQTVKNVLLFIPFGYLFTSLFQNKKGILIVLSGGIISLFIEILQLVSRRGWFDLDDIFSNILGTIIGLGICKVFLRLHLSSSTEDRNDKGIYRK